MSERFTRWGRRQPEEPKALAPCATFEPPILAASAPGIPGLQKRSFARALSVAKRSASPAGCMIYGAVPFDAVIQTADGYGELLVPGAFAASLITDDPRVLFNFNVEKVIGRKSSGTVVFQETRDSLRFEANMPDTSWGDDVLTLIRRGDVDSVAVAFQIMEYVWGERDGLRVRQITKARLLAASVSTYDGFQTLQAEAQTAIENAHSEGFRAGLALASKPQARVSATAQLSAPISARTMSTRKTRALLERMNYHV
jgi:HK97 family phage prohead protease